MTWWFPGEPKGVYWKSMKTKTTTSPTNNNTDRLGEIIKLGVDVHEKSYVVVMKIDSSAPLRAKRMSPQAFLSWIGQLRRRCDCLYSCYEAGPFGYGLHRKLEAMGVTNYVIQPINWDEHGKNVKTDARDAQQMVLSLDGYLRGNGRSFSVVHVPSVEAERKRSMTRMRASMVKERGRTARRGAGIARYYGERLTGDWWRPRRWAALQEQLDGSLIELLDKLRELCEQLDKMVNDCEEQLKEHEPEALRPKGMGTVLFEQMEREVCDWNRFPNRKSISSYTGLCPSEDTSASRRFKGSVNKHGNPRLRHMLVECVWLLMQWNPDYRGLVKWRSRLEAAANNKSTKKKIVIAIAREFAVDWWRVRTGRTTLENLGLVTKAAAN